jgi:hypothetical protein
VVDQEATLTLRILEAVTGGLITRERSLESTFCARLSSVRITCNLCVETVLDFVRVGALCSVEEALIEMYLAGVSVRRVEDINRGRFGAREYRYVADLAGSAAYLFVRKIPSVIPYRAACGER